MRPRPTSGLRGSGAPCLQRDAAFRQPLARPAAVLPHGAADSRGDSRQGEAVRDTGTNRGDRCWDNKISREGGCEMRTTISVVALCLLTAACGSNVEQRSSTGALTGAGVGALAGGPIGAVVGAAVGGLGGAATPIGANQAFNKALGISHQSVAQSNFPPPPGSNAATTASGSSMSATTTSTTTAVPMSRQTVRKIQRSLRQAGD